MSVKSMKLQDGLFGHNRKVDPIIRMSLLVDGERRARGEAGDRGAIAGDEALAASWREREGVGAVVGR